MDLVFTVVLRKAGHLTKNTLHFTYTLHTLHIKMYMCITHKDTPKPHCTHLHMHTHCPTHRTRHHPIPHLAHKIPRAYLGQISFQEYSLRGAWISLGTLRSSGNLARAQAGHRRASATARCRFST